MIQALYSGVSGVQAHQTKLDVIGNNIANVNTVGFKAGRVNFEDLLSHQVRGAVRPDGGVGGLNPMQVGLGVRVGSISNVMTQGSLQQTGRPSDIAIQGNGFFMLGDGSRTSYSRDGAFSLDANGTLVHAASGLKVLGWPGNESGTIDNTVPVTAASELKIPIGTLTSSQATGVVTLAGNLNSDATTTDTFDKAGQIYDSLGNPHSLTFRFQKTAAVAPAAATWQYTTSVDGGAFSTAGGANSGVLNFDTDGTLISQTGTITVTPGGGASTFTVNPDFTNISQRYGEYSANVVAQDGFPFGTLESYDINENGLITGVFSNGLTRDLGQIAVAQFGNPTGLDKVGGNLYNPTANSGAVQVTAPGSSGSGFISSGFLEQSNVNLADEFTNMIITQRGFQANTRIVTASDEILQDLLQMKR